MSLNENHIPTPDRQTDEVRSRRCHVRQMRGRELVNCPDAIRAFIIEGREVPTHRKMWGTAAMAIDRAGNTAWAIDGGKEVLVVGATDMVTVVMDMEEAGFEVVGIRPAA